MRQFSLRDTMPFGIYTEELIGSILCYDPAYLLWCTVTVGLKLDETASLALRLSDMEAGWDYTMKFGKHKGKTLRELVEERPGYVIWLATERVISIQGHVVTTAIVLEKARLAERRERMQAETMRVEDLERKVATYEALYREKEDLQQQTQTSQEWLEQLNEQLRFYESTL